MQVLPLEQAQRAGIFKASRFSAPVLGAGRDVASGRVEAEPSARHLLLLAGKIRLLEGDCEKALEAFERSAKLEPKPPGAHYQRALLYARMGENRKSEEAFEIQRQ